MDLPHTKGAGFAKTCFNGFNALSGSELFLFSSIFVPLFLHIYIYTHTQLLNQNPNSCDRNWIAYHPLCTFKIRMVKSWSSSSYGNNNLLHWNLAHQMLEHQHIHENVFRRGISGIREKGQNSGIHFLIPRGLPSPNRIVDNGG